MAIYDVDAIRESELMEAETDSDSVLDNMLEACDQMLAALDESKARHRTVEALKSRKERYENNARTYQDLYNAADKVGNNKLASKYAGKSAENRSKSLEVNNDLNIIDSERRGGEDFAGKYAERDFKERYNATPAKEQRKPGFYKDLYEKKKAIKETCLTILSVLDEI